VVIAVLRDLVLRALFARREERDHRALVGDREVDTAAPKAAGEAGLHSRHVLTLAGPVGGLRDWRIRHRHSF